MGNKEKPNSPQEIIEKNVFNSIKWQENISVLDLSNREISTFDENVKLPSSLIVLNLSNNNFIEVPTTVLKLEQLKILNLSYNKIVFFDDAPNFCHTLESLNLSNNLLERPPCWIWTESPKNLVQLNISNNIKLCNSFDDYYFEELLQYTTLVNNIDIHNCMLNKHKKILSTFKHAKVVKAGDSNFNYMSVNHLEQLPCVGLEDCCDIEVLNVSNTHIYNIQHNIDIYKNLREMDLSENKINSLPNEFCSLINLEICVLSFNNILYLPEDIHKLTKLIKLYLDNNELCMLPESLTQLCHLKTLDLYNNHLYEGLDDVSQLEEYDFAQNYNNEPDSEDYLERKRKLRCNISDRVDGRAPEIIHEESEKSEEESFGEDDEPSEPQQVNDSRCSTPEDWDSDEHWVPLSGDFYYPCSVSISKHTPTISNLEWLNFVKRKMDEGNFCPMDMHLAVSISEKVANEKKNNPQPAYESDGQFDDYSDDET